MRFARGELVPLRLVQRPVCACKGVCCVSSSRIISFIFAMMTSPAHIARSTSILCTYVAPGNSLPVL